MAINGDFHMATDTRGWQYTGPTPSYSGPEFQDVHVGWKNGDLTAAVGLVSHPTDAHTHFEFAVLK